MSLSTSAVYAAATIDNLRLGKNPCLKHVTEFRRGILATFGVQDFSNVELERIPTKPLLAFNRAFELLCYQGITGDVLQTVEMIGDVHQRLARVQAASVNELESLRDFCLELSRQLSAQTSLDVFDTYRLRIVSHA